jgi:hypothetical protein
VDRWVGAVLVAAEDDEVAARAAVVGELLGDGHDQRCVAESGEKVFGGHGLCG